MRVPTPIVYPESDGKPMSDNTKQFRWIFVLFSNLAAMFHDKAEVFVSGNQNWYPVEGEPDICMAPDVYVVFGRPKGDRGSYKQWEEDNTPMTVVFEVLSPSNTHLEMADKLTFYDEHGVEEYYIYDPDNNQLQIYQRRGSALVRIRKPAEYQSPRLGIRFDFKGPEMVVRYPDGRAFLTFEELNLLQRQTAQRADTEAKRADTEAKRADTEAKRADRAELRAEQEAKRAGRAEERAEEEAKRATQAETRAKQAEQRATRLAELAVKVQTQQATPEEIAELVRLTTLPQRSE